MDAKEARDYISRFHLIIRKPHPLSFVVMNSGRMIEFKDMTDEQAVHIAGQLQDMEREAGTPQEASIQ